MAGVHPHDAIRDILPKGGDVYLVLEDECPAEDIGRRRKVSVWANEAFRQGPQGDYLRFDTKMQYHLQEVGDRRVVCVYYGHHDDENRR
jgi:hypothetical protein